MAVLAVPAVDGPGTEDRAGARALTWPGPALPGEDVDGASCAVVSGTGLPRVLDAASQATARTVWSGGGRICNVCLRLLLPEERGCRDVAETPGQP